MSATLSLQTPSQTVGPFFHFGLVRGGENILAHDGARGLRIVFTGRVLDGDRTPLPDVLIELWQADSAGIYQTPADPRAGQADPCFNNFGRSDSTHPGTAFRFDTVKPGSVPGDHGAPQAPHLCLRLFGRGLLTHLTTRIYFADESDANAGDATLARVDSNRRTTLLAQRDLGDTAIPIYRLDLILQGPGETVFFQP
jgi:protocatechuate 3,4-dioxygenase alpha subunit